MLHVHVHVRVRVRGVVGIQRPTDPNGLLQPRASQAAAPRTYYTGAMLYMMPLGRGVSKDKANWAGK